MTTYTENHQLKNELILHDSFLSSISINNVSLNFIKQDDQIIECRLTFPVNLELYQRIEKDALFNLKPEIRSPFIGGKFLLETDITIEITLQPDLLPQLLENANNIEQAATYLLKLSQHFDFAQCQQSENQENINPLLQTENWLCLSVKQTQNNQEIGYSTFWNYVNPATINNPDKISQGIVDFFQEWTQTNLSTTGIINNSISDIFKNFTDEIFGETNNNNINQTMLTTIINFFLEDDWTFTKIEGETSLRLGFQGDNGTWNCYAKVREEQKQFVFYSICPFKVEEDKRLTISEFITRANYGMINGNFEMDFNDGEIRYKTSIDVDGDQLSSALIKNIVYANVTMMDEYLPGIINVIESDIYPELAINKIEQNEEINQSLDQVEQLPLIIAVDEQKEDLKTQERTPYILTILTPEEIAQFHHALQLMPPYQHKQANAILENLKKELISRLGELGEKIFIQANIFFKEITISAKNIKLIQRYSGIAGKIQSLVEKLQSLSQKDDELPINTPELKAISDLQTLFNSVEQRLQELPSDALIGNKEVELLVEIEDLRANLVRREKLL
ncbi:YbjN domain-containing protein [Anabaena sp. UHCC 0204]|uniref:YbjN domain-containing protein n=1 Tax=Anabaena sp. UHCC 0204 TaxID=2590009 RepID=UPI001444A493|nr:YbjN domain-containing protein [Anabaena sp. UHCC 0204]MTJ08140.1 hypothetical protein [Anabaena sp. UHCC 0204]